MHIPPQETVIARNSNLPSLCDTLSGWWMTNLHEILKGWARPGKKKSSLLKNQKSSILDSAATAVPHLSVPLLLLQNSLKCHLCEVSQTPTPKSTHSCFYMIYIILAHTLFGSYTILVHLCTFPGSYWKARKWRVHLCHGSAQQSDAQSVGSQKVLLNGRMNRFLNTDSIIWLDPSHH